MTVGTQIPFDRLVRAVDEWCRDRGRSDVFGQIAEPGARGYRPAHFEWRTFVEPREFGARMEEAQLVVAHAGIGSIIAALTLAKPLIIMPRRADLGEHRNEHQAATAARFAERAGIVVAADETALPGLLDQALGGTNPTARLSNPFADARLTGVIRNFIRGEGD